MRALETETGALASGQVAVPRATRCRHRGAGCPDIGVPGIGDAGTLVEIQGYFPTTDRGVTLVGDGHIQDIATVPGVGVGRAGKSVDVARD